MHIRFFGRGPRAKPWRTARALKRLGDKRRCAVPAQNRQQMRPISGASQECPPRDFTSAQTASKSEPSPIMGHSASSPVSSVLQFLSDLDFRVVIEKLS